MTDGLPYAGMNDQHDLSGALINAIVTAIGDAATKVQGSPEVDGDTINGALTTIFAMMLSSNPDLADPNKLQEATDHIAEDLRFRVTRLQEFATATGKSFIEAKKRPTH